MSIPAITDNLPISYRVYAHKRFEELRESKIVARPKQIIEPEHDDLIFDCETTADNAQSLRFGAYQHRKRGKLKESGLFYDPDGVSTAELKALRRYAETQGLAFLTVEQFVCDKFMKIGKDWGGQIIGFNLPFDISRIAIRHNSARNSPHSDMTGGFTFQLSPHKYHPHVQIKALGTSSAFIRFAATMGQIDTRSQRKRGNKSPHKSGYFVDIKSLARSLISRKFSLSSLAKFLGVETQKQEFDDFHGPINEAMISYCLDDVQATWECYAELKLRLDELHLPIPPYKAYSEASIGKAYLRAMGIVPWEKAQPHYPRQTIANIMSAYFGGRSEIKIRRQSCQVLLCDFLSMYPTVCTLMGLWRFVISQGYSTKDSTKETQDFLDGITIDELAEKQIWQRLTTLVRILPQGEVFPVRAKYADQKMDTIGANHLSSEAPLWYTLADCIAAKLLSGKAPQVVEAVTFEPLGELEELKPVLINGNADYVVDPYREDFFKRCIELRHEVKAAMKELNADIEQLDALQQSIKIAANATSYGVWVEVNVSEYSKPVSTTVHSPTDKHYIFQTKRLEKSGPFFNPLLAALITGAARLMLAIGETKAIDAGLGWAFCDTDSMAFAKPDAMTSGEFQTRVQSIVDWFGKLNPYTFGGSILKIEDQNYGLESNALEPLYCFAVSSKRYALYNLNSAGNPVMRKVSAHGLGHLLPPYEDAGERDFPIPHKSVLKDGILLWHVDLWRQIVMAGLSENPNQVDLSYHPAMNSPTVSRYGATSPEMLRWFKSYNADRVYRDQVKPHGFLLSLIARKQIGGVTIADAPKRGRKPKPKEIKPIAPFDKDRRKALRLAFDRETGESISIDKLETYAETLAQYHLHPENKFLGGDYFDIGPTQRRHIKVSGFKHIGKEAHNWENGLTRTEQGEIIKYDQEFELDRNGS